MYTATIQFFKKFSTVSFAVIIGAVFVLGMFSPAQAQGGLGAATDRLNDAVGPDTGVGLPVSLPGTISTVVQAALALVGTIFLVLTIYAGILWMTAQGAEDKIEKAQSIIKATVIGLFITLSAYAITFFVAARLAGGVAGVGGEGGAPGAPAGSGIKTADCIAQGGECRDAADNCDPAGVGKSDPYEGSNLGICSEEGKTIECCVLKDSETKCGNMGGVCLKACAAGQTELGSCGGSDLGDSCCK